MFCQQLAPVLSQGLNELLCGCSLSKPAEDWYYQLQQWLGAAGYLQQQGLES
jgi:hypothetical protein